MNRGRVKKFMILLWLEIYMMALGCGKIPPNPYELNKDAIKSMRPAQQEDYIHMIQSLEELVAALDEEGHSDEEAMAMVSAFYDKMPNDVQWKTGSAPIDKAWRFFMKMYLSFTGSQTSASYADSKDEVDALGKELSDYFIQANDRRRALIMSEDRFDELFEAGKKKALQQQNEK